MPQPPAPAGGKKKTGLIIGAVAVVAAVAVGVYFAVGGSGGSDVADDGPHKLITPAKVINGTYKKSDQDSADQGMSQSDLKKTEALGVKDPKDVSAGYSYGSGLAGKSLGFSGVYGTINDPEKVVDGLFTMMKEDSEKDTSSKGRLVGSPQKMSPSGFSNGVMKCQSVETKESGKTITTPICAWGDHSTVAYVVSFDFAGIATGKSTSLEDAAQLAAELRNDVRVKA
jgi:hypothetical protein